ncbi:MAG: histidine triad nucleotide-binding protein [Candidatus Gastranaerophilaceae bacterium]
MDCIFCKIANKEIPTDAVFENDRVIAFNDLNPQAPVHVLVIPKKHYASLNEIDDFSVGADILEGISQVVKKLGIKEYRTVINTGKFAGQSVFHVHAHILSGKNLSEILG